MFKEKITKHQKDIMIDKGVEKEIEGLTKFLLKNKKIRDEIGYVTYHMIKGLKVDCSQEMPLSFGLAKFLIELEKEKLIKIL